MASDELGDGLQQTLAGGKIEQTRRTCGVYNDDACGNAAAYDFGDVVACERCAAEITEPKDPDESEKCRKLLGREKLVTEGPA